MEFSTVLSRRRMIRNYTTEEVDERVLADIASAALRAPSAGNSQAVSVVVITDARTRGEIASLADEEAYVEKGFDPWISRAPAHIVIAVSEEIYRDRYAEPDKLGPDGETIEWRVPYWWVDAGASLMAVLLTAVDKGMGAGFLGVHSTPELGRLLGIPDHYHPIGVVTVGHPAPDRRSTSLDRPKRSKSSVIHHGKWRNG